MRWDYRVIVNSRFVPEDEPVDLDFEWLTKLGHDGWEAVTADIYRGHYLFKRPRPLDRAPRV